MEAEEDGGEVEGQEAVEQVAGRMVVGGDEAVGGVDGVVPGLVPVGEGAAGWGVQELLVDVVLQDLGVAFSSGSVTAVGEKGGNDTYVSR